MKLALLGLLLLAQFPPKKPSPGKKYSSTIQADREQLALRLLTHVASVEGELPPDKDEVRATNRLSGFGVVWSERQIAVQSFVVDRARGITVTGPKGKLSATLVKHDKNLRVSILQTDEDLRDIGLKPAKRQVRKGLKVDDPVFAVISTLPGSGVVDGAVINTGDLPEYEGHPRIDLVLKNGMPVFDNYARFVGYARYVAWDKDRFMLVPTDHILSVTSTVTNKPQKPDCPEAKVGLPCPPADKPWWAK